MSLNKAIASAQDKLGNKSMRIEQMEGGYTCDHSSMGDYNNAKHVLKTHHEVAKHVKEHFGPGAGKEKK